MGYWGSGLGHSRSFTLQIIIIITNVDINAVTGVQQAGLHPW